MPRLKHPDKSAKQLVDEILRRFRHQCYTVLMEKRKVDEVYLVTGNIKHFPVRTYVVTPREMLDIIEEGR